MSEMKMMLEAMEAGETAVDYLHRRRLEKVWEGTTPEQREHQAAFMAALQSKTRPETMVIKITTAGGN